MIIIITD